MVSAVPIIPIASSMLLQILAAWRTEDTDGHMSHTHVQWYVCPEDHPLLPLVDLSVPSMGGQIPERLDVDSYMVRQRVGTRCVCVCVWSYLSGADLATVHHIGSHAGEELLGSLVLLLQPPHHEGQLGQAGSSYTCTHTHTHTHTHMQTLLFFREHRLMDSRVGID